MSFLKNFADQLGVAVGEGLVIGNATFTIRGVIENFGALKGKLAALTPLAAGLTIERHGTSSTRSEPCLIGTPASDVTSTVFRNRPCDG